MAGEKFTNIVGVPFKKYVKRQLEARAFQGSTTTRTDDQVMYLANKNCWIRLVSFINVEDKESTGESGNYLAKNWMLFGGTSYMTQNTNGAYNVANLRYGLETAAFTPGAGSDTRITNNSAYGLGGIEQLGYRPMPGIISATIEHAGTAGSLRIANIKFKVWNIEQLNIIDALYFRLGFSCLLEWGHSSYIKNGTNEIETIISPLDVFSDPAMKTKEGISRRISEKRKETFGNYDAMYGLVSNYEWNQSSDGGYDCTVKLVGLGSVIDSLKINQVYGQTEAAGSTSTVSTSNSSTLSGANPDTSLRNAPSLEEPYITGDNLAFPQAKVIYVPNKDVVKLNLSPDSLFRKSYGTYKMKYLYQNANGSLKAGKLAPGDEIYTAEMLSYNGISDFEQIVKDKVFKFKVEDSTDITGKVVGKNITFYCTIKVTDGKDVYKTDVKDEKTGKMIPVLTERDLGDKIVDYLRTAAKVINFFTPAGPEPTKGSAASNINKELKNDIELKYLYLEYTLPFNDSLFNYILPNLKAVGELVTVDKNDIDGTLERTLIEFYNNYHGNNISKAGDKNPVVYVKPELVTLTNKTVTAKLDNVVLQKSKLNNTNQAEIRVAIKVQDTSGNQTINNAFRAATVDELLKLLIQSVQNTYNNFPNKGLIELTLRNAGDKIDKKLFNSEKAALKEYPWRVPGIVLATITYRYNEQAILNPTNSESVVPLDSTDTIQSTLPVIYTNNIDKFLIALRDSVGVGEAGGIDRREFIEDQLKNGSLEKIRKKNIKIDPNKSLTNLNIEELLYAYIQKGFNSELVAGDTEDKENLAINYNMVPNVNYTNPNGDDYLFKIYRSGLFDEYKTGETSKFIFIKLGLLLYYINNLCLLYESEGSEDVKKPFVYIDFNPATNFCLTTQYHLSVDPGICIMPINLSNQAYLSLFPNKLLDPATAFKTEDDFVSNQVNTGFNVDVAQSRGKIMNLGINMDYIINLLTSQANNNPKSDVYLRSFLETLMEDINKSLGNINLFRVGYYDDANTVRIYDDQIINPPTFQSLIQVNNNSELYPYGIPIMGKNSIIRSLTLKTETSTALSNEIAISAQVGNFGAMNSDASSLGNLNKNQRFIITDRIMQVKQTAVNPTLTQKEKESIEADKSAALNFNKHIKNLYNGQVYVKADINVAKNYYCSAANKLKADSISTISRKVLPISINISTDGISGMSLLEGFTIPTDILPSQYQDSLGRSKVGFAVAGLNHSIEGNQWVTSIRGQMINLPIAGSINSNEFGQSSISTNIGKEAPSNLVYENPGPPVPIGKNPLLKNQEFLNRVGQIARKYGFKPEDMIKLFQAEAGLDPAADNINPDTGKLTAAGLIQFTRDSGVLTYKSAKKLNVKILEDVLRLSAINQLDLVDEYFSYAPISKLSNQEKGTFFGLYILNFMPILAGLADNAIVKSDKYSAAVISRRNAGIAKASGKIPGEALTKGDFRRYCAKTFNVKLPDGLKFG